MLLLAVVDDWDPVMAHDICDDILGGSQVLSFVCKADNIVVLRKVTERSHVCAFRADVFDGVGQILHASFRSFEGVGQLEVEWVVEHTSNCFAVFTRNVNVFGVCFASCEDVC